MGPLHAGKMVLGHQEVSGKPDSDFRAEASAEGPGRIQSSSARKKGFHKPGPVGEVVGS